MLAAGLARRMGRQKLLLTLQGRSLVRWSVESLRPHVEDLVVVTGRDDAPLRTALEGADVRFVANPHPEAGQGSSIAVGVASLSVATRAVVIALGDQPRVPDDVLRTLVATWRRTGKAIVAPVYRGVQGTPVLFAAEVFVELCALGGDAGARSVVAREDDRVARVPFDIAMPSDVDTPEDFARLHVE